MTESSEKHYIKLEGIEAHAPVGYYPEERKTGIAFIVNIEIATDFSGTELRDEINDTINYEDLVKVIKREMEVPAKLIEHTAHRIKNEILRLFPSITHLRLELKKQHPALVLKTASADIIIECSR